VDVGVGAHLDGDGAVGDGLEQVRRLAQMQGMAEAEGVQLEDCLPDAFGIVVFAGAHTSAVPRQVG
jgi:hypothetical protein